MTRPSISSFQAEDGMGSTAKGIATQAGLFDENIEYLDRLRNPVLSARVGLNATLFADIARLYMPPGGRVLDMTYGLGNFWNVRGLKERYQLVTMDIERPATVRGSLFCPPFRDGSFDVVVLDPPYALQGTRNNSVLLKGGIDNTYNLKPGNDGIKLLSMYESGITAATRLLSPGGVIIIKCQDHIESGKQHWNHVAIMAFAEAAGFIVEDLFILVQNGTPTMRHNYQLHARKNHSYFIVARKIAPK